MKILLLIMLLPLLINRLKSLPQIFTSKTNLTELNKQISELDDKLGKDVGRGVVIFLMLLIGLYMTTYYILSMFYLSTFITTLFILFLLFKTLRSSAKLVGYIADNTQEIKSNVAKSILFYVLYLGFDIYLAYHIYMNWNM